MPQNWWMYHGDPAHTGEVTDSNISSSTIKNLQNIASVNVPGSILSTPAVVDGFIYVGLANSHAPGVETSNGGTMLKVDITTGNTVASFIAFNGVFYCLNAADMSLAWQTNLRWEDPPRNQPIRNVRNYTQAPQAAGWSSPVMANGKLWVGIGEGENPNLYAFVYCLDAPTGDVVWIYCTCQYEQGVDNKVNVLPADFVAGPLNAPFTTVLLPNGPVSLGASVWGCIAYDPDLDALYCPTGNPVPDSTLPSSGYSNGILVLKASTGDFVKFIQFPWQSSYRPSDADIDVGGSPTLFTRNGQKVIGIGCKNGAYMLIDATTLNIITWRQMLPYMNDGSQIPTVDPHGPDTSSNPNPSLTNEQSNATSAENFHGTYSTAAISTSQQKLFIGVGGNNYHYICAGIDYETTPFMRAMDWNTLDDAWPMDGDPKKYTLAAGAMYQNPGESGLSVPAVVNDLVFMATTQVAMYAFSVKDGTLLWSDMGNFGQQTGGFNGGYGYCLGPAIWGDYVVAGALVAGGEGGVLNIYTLKTPAK
jgi:outer membrane protein assembly factor BamB